MSQVIRGSAIGAIPGTNEYTIDFVEVVTPVESTDPQVASAPIGSRFPNTNGASGHVLYVKETNTGDPGTDYVAK